MNSKMASTSLLPKHPDVTFDFAKYYHQHQEAENSERDRRGAAEPFCTMKI